MIEFIIFIVAIAIALGGICWRLAATDTEFSAQAEKPVSPGGTWNENEIEQIVYRFVPKRD